ncbi:hypothetical protein XENOCAPTIV_003118, partial [Xenoophorus captivus]
DSRPSRCLTFSRDGTLFGWCNGHRLVFKCLSPSDKMVTHQPSVHCLSFSVSVVAVYVPGSKGAPSFVRLYQYPVLGGASAALANKSFFKADRVNMQWNQKEFCVVYGFMPAKATVFNLKCDPVFDFGTGPRNAAYYRLVRPNLSLGIMSSSLLVLDVSLNLPTVSKPQAPDATYFSWCPDGEHIVTATCSPRLRVSNGYKIWHYTGTVLHKQDAAAGSELWKVHWQPFPEGSFPERPIKYQAAPSELGTTEAAPIQAYRPPALRHLPATPSSKLEAKSDPEPACLPAPVSNSQSEACSGDAETDKKIKNLKKVESHQQQSIIRQLDFLGEVFLPVLILTAAGTPETQLETQFPFFFSFTCQNEFKVLKLYY